MNSFSTVGAPNCAPETQVGVITLTGQELRAFSTFLQLIPIYNITPPADRPALFGFRLLRNNVGLNAEVRTGGDYGLISVIKDLPGGLQIPSSDLTPGGSSGLGSMKRSASPSAAGTHTGDSRVLTPP